MPLLSLLVRERGQHRGLCDCDLGIGASCVRGRARVRARVRGRVKDPDSVGGTSGGDVRRQKYKGGGMYPITPYDPYSPYH